MINHMHINFYLRQSTTLTGQAALYVRITVNKERLALGAVSSVSGLQIPKSIMIDTRHWDSAAERVKSVSPQAGVLNRAIEECRRKLNKIYNQHEGFDITMKADRVKDLFLNGGNVRPTIPELIDVFLQEKAKTGSPISTLDTYKHKFAPLKAFLISKNSIKTPAEEFSPGMLKQYKIYLMEHRHNQERSADKSCQVVKTLLLWAADAEKIKNNPLINTRIRVDKTPNLTCLTQAEVQQIQEAILIPFLRKVADCFIFACYTGLAYQDLKNLTPKHLQLVEGHLCLVGKRQKTGTEYCIPVTPVVSELMKKYSGVKMPLPSNTDYNNMIRQVIYTLGIDKHITTHTARKTFADWCINELCMSEEATIVAMGQKDARELAAYRKTRPKRLLHEFPAHLLQGLSPESPSPQTGSVE